MRTEGVSVVRWFVAFRAAGILHTMLLNFMFIPLITTFEQSVTLLAVTKRTYVRLKVSEDMFPIILN